MSTPYTLGPGVEYQTTEAWKKTRIKHFFVQPIANWTIFKTLNEHAARHKAQCEKENQPKTMCGNFAAILAHLSFHEKQSTYDLSIWMYQFLVQWCFVRRSITDGPWFVRNWCGVSRRPTSTHLSSYEELGDKKRWPLNNFRFSYFMNELNSVRAIPRDHVRRRRRKKCTNKIPFLCVGLFFNWLHMLTTLDAVLVINNTTISTFDDSHA